MMTLFRSAVQCAGREWNSRFCCWNNDRLFLFKLMKYNMLLQYLKIDKYRKWTLILQNFLLYVIFRVGIKYFLVRCYEKCHKLKITFIYYNVTRNICILIYQLQLIMQITINALHTKLLSNWDLNTEHNILLD